VGVDLLHHRASFYTEARQGHILSAGFGVILIGLAGFDILLHRLGTSIRFGALGISSPLLVAIYVVAMRTAFRHERAQRLIVPDDETPRHERLTMRAAVWGYVRWALVIVAAGAWLPFVGAQLADAMGWHRSFVGTLFVAGATSLPEVVVTLAAVRAGALDLAIGNLLGSNLFNMLILGIDDLAYSRGPLLADVSAVHAVSALSAVMMTGVAIVALVYRPSTRLFRLVGWSSIVLFALYLLNSFVLFLHGSRAIAS
jgi:cation:H+ antiporter